MSLSEKKLSLIVVDDHKMVADSIANTLKSSRCFKRIKVVYNGSAAIAEMMNYQHNVVFMDYSMPGMKGDIAARKIAEQFPQTKIIALTGYNELYIVNAMMEAGCISFLLKESALPVLIETISKAIAGDSYVDTNISSTLFSKVARTDSVFGIKSKN